MAKIELMLSVNSRDLGDEMYDEVYEQTVNGLEIYPKNNEFPLPWDATLYIEGDTVVLDGYVGASGTQSGTCIAKVPLSKIMNFIGLSVTVEGEQLEDEMRAMFDKYGWL